MADNAQVRSIKDFIVKAHKAGACGKDGEQVPREKPGPAPPLHTLYEYIPREFNDSEEPQRKCGFSNEEELNECVFVKQRRDQKGFFRLSVCEEVMRNGGLNRTLMAEFDGGRDWYVVGTVMGWPLWLPKWKPKKGKYVR